MSNKGVRKDTTTSANMAEDMFKQVGKPAKHISANKKNADPLDDYKWWEKDEKEIANCVGQVVMRIENANGQRRMNFVRFAHLYGNYEALGWQNVQTANNTGSNNRIRLNLIQSIVDACSAKIAKDQPKPFFITNGADFFTRLAAEKCTQFVEGVFEMNKFYEISNEVFRDAGVYGTGAPHWFIEDSKIKCEWCFVDELKVDDYDGMYKMPRSLHRVKIVNKEVIEAKFPDYKDQLNSYVAETNGAKFRRKQSVVQMLRVRESWHLPSKQGADDGVHCITIGDLCLLKESYQKNFFPIPVWRWYNKPLGWYGRSITEEIYSIQFEVNKMLQTAQQAYELVGVPVAFVESGSDVSEDDIGQNFVARLISYTGTKPIFETPEPLPSSFFQLLNNQIQWAFQTVGLSQSSATGMKPEGVDSGAAIREVVDIETGRFAQVGSRWEEWFCENAFIVLDLAHTLHDQMKNNDKDLTITKTYKKQIMQINFSSLADISENFNISCDPVSSLPDTPQGRIQTISEYIANKWIGKERGMELLNLDPDLDREVELQTASLRRLDKDLTDMVESGNQIMPDPYLRLDQALEVSLQVYNLLKLQGCPEDRLKLVRVYMDGIVNLMKQPNPLAPPPPTAPLAPTNAPAGAPPPPGMLPPGMLPPPQGQ